MVELGIGTASKNTSGEEKKESESNLWLRPNDPGLAGVTKEDKGEIHTRGQL